jgi:hypothetical protein
MLEQPQLWIPTRPSADSPGKVLAGPSGPVLGTARWLPAPGLFSAAVLSVHEDDEAPLLFRARRAWTFWRRHAVVDADDHPVGYVQADALLTPSARPLVWRIASKQATVYHLVGGPVLATERAEGTGRWLEFGTGEGTDNPFLRMLVLAAVLLG